MYKSVVVAVAILATGSIATSCKSSSDNVEEKQEDVNDANENLDKAQIEFEKDLEFYRKSKFQSIEENEKSISELKAEYESDKKETKEEYTAKIEALEKTNKSLKLKMEEYKPSNYDSWKKFEREFNHEMDEFGKAIKDFMANRKK